MTQTDLVMQVAVTGIVIAGAVNSVVKGGMAAVIGGRSLGLRVALPLLAAAAAGPFSAWLWLW